MLSKGGFVTLKGLGFHPWFLLLTGEDGSSQSTCGDTSVATGSRSEWSNPDASSMGIILKSARRLPVSTLPEAAVGGTSRPITIRETGVIQRRDDQASKESEPLPHQLLSGRGGRGGIELDTAPGLPVRVGCPSVWVDLPLPCAH